MLRIFVVAAVALAIPQINPPPMMTNTVAIEAATVSQPPPTQAAVPPPSPPVRIDAPPAAAPLRPAARNPIAAAAVVKTTTTTTTTEATETTTTTETPELQTSTPSQVPLTEQSPVPVSVFQKPIFFALGTTITCMLMILSGLIIMFHRSKKFRAHHNPFTQAHSRPKSGGSWNKAITSNHSYSKSQILLSSSNGKLSSPVLPIYEPQNRYSINSIASFGDLDVATDTMADEKREEST